MVEKESHKAVLGSANSASELHKPDFPTSRLLIKIVHFYEASLQPAGTLIHTLLNGHFKLCSAYLRDQKGLLKAF